MLHHTKHRAHFSHGFALPATLLFTIGGCFNEAQAYDWGSDYGVSTGVGIHDNYRLTSENETDSASYEVGGFANVVGRTEISRVGLTLRTRYRTFSDSSIDDETSYNLALDTSRNDERLSSYLTVSYAEASTTETELEDTGVTEDGTRKTASISPGVGYQLDERNSVAADLNYRDVSYDTVSLTEYTNTSLSLSWSHGLDEARSITPSYVYTVYDPDDPEDPDDDGTTEINTVNLGYSHAVTQATSYNAVIGVSFVDEPQGSETSGVGSVSVVHEEDERNVLTMSLSRSYEGSGDGDVREEDRIDLQWDHALTEISQTVLSLGSLHTDNRDYYTFGIWRETTRQTQGLHDISGPGH